MRIDIEKVIDNTGGDRELVVNIAKIFIKKHESQLDNISNAIDTDDGELLWRSAHTLKGTISYFLIDTIDHSVKELESKGREGNLDGAKELYADFKSQVGQLVNILKSEFSI